MPDFTNYGTGYDLDTVGGPSWTLSGTPVPARYVIAYREPVFNQGRAGDVVAYAAASLKAHQEFDEGRAYYTFDILDFISNLSTFDANIGSAIAIGTATATGTGVGFSTNAATVTGTASVIGVAEIANKDEGHSTIQAIAIVSATGQSTMVAEASVTASAVASGTALPDPIVPPIPPPVIDTGPPAASAMTLLEYLGYLARIEIFKLKEDYSFDISSSYKLIDIDEVKDALLTLGPVLLGMELDSGFRDVPSTYVLPEPTGSVTERHAFVIYGWDDDIETDLGNGALLIKNSWGLDYGNRGFVWMPYSYLAAYAFDAWVSEDSTNVISVIP